MADNFKTCEARLRILKRKLDDRNILKEYNEIFKDYKSKKKLLKEYQKKKKKFFNNSIVILADIKQVFPNDEIYKEHRDYLRFSWYNDATSENEAKPIIYRNFHELHLV